MQKVLIINENDNVAVAVQPLKKGDKIDINMKDQEGLDKIRVREDIPLNYKIALKRIKKGERIMKYGQTIGRAIKDIKEGECVHTDNVESTKGRGDLQEK